MRNVKGVDPQEQLRQRRFNQLRAGWTRIPKKGKKHKAKVKAKAKARKAAKAQGKKKKA
uniref:FGENESH: predicted gene_5.484 protein n=1 Tax=Rhodotorula toruloides TaxID=5286 RepID=A0A0K3CDT2_RHOTO